MLSCRPGRAGVLRGKQVKGLCGPAAVSDELLSKCHWVTGKGKEVYAPAGRPA